jgi:hypothetical protein
MTWGAAAGHSTEYPVVDEQSTALEIAAQGDLISYNQAQAGTAAYYELLSLPQNPRDTTSPNACTHDSAHNSEWGCVAMCKSHSTYPYPGPAHLGDGRYHDCMAQVTATPSCTCVFRPIQITIDSDVTHWYKRPAKRMPEARRVTLSMRQGGDYLEAITLGGGSTFETCADYCLASDWTAGEPCKSFGWEADTGTCELYSESEAELIQSTSSLTATAGWDFYEQVPGAGSNWWEKPARNPGYCSHTSMAADSVAVAKCAAETDATACDGDSDCTWTAALTFSG